MEPEFELVSDEIAEEYDIGHSIAKLYNSCPFLGYIFSSLNRVEDNSISTICVTDTNVMRYNRRFMASLTLEWSKYVLLHECMHKINEHFKRGNSYALNKFGKPLLTVVQEDPDVMRDFNIAMDISINQLCDAQFERPPFGVHIEKVSEKIGIELERSREWEYYYSLLINHNTEDVENEDHAEHFESTNDESEDSDTNEYEEIFSEIVNRAKEEQREWDDTHNVASGSSIVDMLPDENVKVKDRKLWKGVIGNAIGHNRIRDKEFTIRKPNRRDDNNPIGRVFKKRTTKCLVVVDTSGSCMDYLDKFFGIINRAVKRNNLKVDLILCTTNVYKVYNDLSKIVPSDIECQTGGTDLRTAQDYISENYDRGGKGMNCIMITDGYTPWNDKYSYNMSVIYTPYHVKLDGIKHYAIMEE
jgi:predicted metal-dependent peptidase